MKNNMRKMDEKNLQIFAQAIENKMQKLDEFKLSFSSSDGESNFGMMLQKIHEKTEKLELEF